MKIFEAKIWKFIRKSRYTRKNEKNFFGRIFFVRKKFKNTAFGKNENLRSEDSEIYS